MCAINELLLLFARSADFFEADGDSTAIYKKYTKKEKVADPLSINKGDQFTPNIKF